MREGAEMPYVTEPLTVRMAHLRYSLRPKSHVAYVQDTYGGGVCAPVAADIYDAAGVPILNFIARSADSF